MPRLPSFGILLSACLVLATMDIVDAGGLQRCSTPDGGSRLARTPCDVGENLPMDVDRVAPAEVGRVGERAGERARGGPGGAREPAFSRAHGQPGAPLAAPGGSGQGFAQSPRADRGQQVTPGDAGPARAIPDVPPRADAPLRAVVDPLTGRALVPVAAGRVDPVTGTFWIRGAAGYVDPLAGRIIPGGD